MQVVYYIALLSLITGAIAGIVLGSAVGVALGVGMTIALVYLFLGPKRVKVSTFQMYVYYYCGMAIMI